ncbi:hypothetical protein V5E97_06705 [Singulisphaera sp. Ch08]|uniref:Uncharacterized protein n=1 Tax=Singulisphaera sp. Ch08 TaxID=3120278 RepID=A0AAU7CJS7_9BACT
MFDANQLAANFQGSVGGAEEENKKQTGILSEMRKTLDQLANTGVVRFDRTKK